MSFVTLAVLLLAPIGLQGQQKAAQLQPTTASEAARASFRAALYESQNVYPERARAQVDAALKADPQFGLAQVYRVVLAQGLNAAQREAQIAPILGAMGNASTVEVQLALYWREAAAGRGPAAASILRTASELAPGDAEIAYMYDGTLRAGSSPAEQATALRRFLVRFPTHAAGYNTLAYVSWRAGDRDGALSAVQQYAKHAPDHPNSHDSYADILLLLGRGAEAIPHVQKEIELDPTFVGAYSKLGSIYLTTNNVSGARSEFARALGASKTPAGRIDAMYWQAVSSVYERDGRGAVREITRIADEAKTASLPAAVTLAHARAAVVDAYMGNAKAVATHLAAAQAAATNDNQRLTHQSHAAIALSRIGRTAEARAAAQQFRVGAPDSELNAGLAALLALDAKDYAAAETAMRGVDTSTPLGKALRAELLLRNGQTAEGRALRDEVLRSSVKMEGNPPIEFQSVIGRMRALTLK
jgi:predicted Zn-dependent protease